MDYSQQATPAAGTAVRKPTAIDRLNDTLGSIISSLSEATHLFRTAPLAKPLRGCRASTPPWCGYGIKSTGSNKSSWEKWHGKADRQSSPGNLFP